MNLDWSDDWGPSSDGTIFTGTHLQRIQSDLASVLRALSDSNVDPAAAIQESKILFNILTGHRHDGVDSRTIAASTFIAQHYRSGCRIARTGAGTVSVGAGHVEIGGTVYNIATAVTLTLATAGDWAFGSETSNAPAYVYAYNNSGTLGFKFSTEAPDLSDTSDNTIEAPWRYQKYSSTYYRCLGAVWNNASGDVETATESNFDASAIVTGRLVGNGADVTIPTVWTPDFVQVYGPTQDSSPATTEGIDANVNFRQLFTDYTLTIISDGNSGDNFLQAADTTAANAKSFTAQAAGTGGSFTMKAMTAGLVAYYVAMTKHQF